MSEWIKCSERMPEKHITLNQSRRVLINSKYQGVHIGYYQLGRMEGWMKSDGVRMTDVTHWMPLPTPPKEEV